MVLLWAILARNADASPMNHMEVYRDQSARNVGKSILAVSSVRSALDLWKRNGNERRANSKMS